MATALKLKNDIKKLKAAISSKATPKSFVPKLKAQLDKAENELASLKKGGRPRKTSTTKGTATTLSALQKLIQKKKFGVYQGAGVDLKKDAGEGALATGRRVSKGLKSNQWGDASDNKGNVYYEYRANRLDVKQPKKKQTYPKLAKGGYMESGGEIENYSDLEDFSMGYSHKKNKVVSIDNKRYVISQIIGKSDGNEIKLLGIDDDNRNDGIKVLIDYSGGVLKSEKYASGGYMAEGGDIKNQYDGMSPKEVWESWTFEQKKHFLLDHKDHRYSPVGLDKKERIEVAQEYSWNDLPANIKLSVSDHVEDGQYAKGGKLESGVYRIGKPIKVSDNLYEQKIVEIFDNGDIATASDYGRKMSDFRGNTYPIISHEELEAQYKMAKGGYMAKGGETVPYIIWVSKDGEEREFYGDYKSQRAAEMAMNKLWEKGEYNSMGNKPKSSYEKNGLYAKGGYMAKGGDVVKYYGVEFTNTFGISNDDFKKAIDSFYDTGSDVNYERVAARLNISQLTKQLGEEKSKEVFGYIKSKFEEKGVYAKGGYMAGGGEMHKADQFKDGGQVYSEEKLKTILEESLNHFYRGLNLLEQAMGYLEMKKQDGLRRALIKASKLEDLKDAFQNIDEYLSK